MEWAGVVESFDKTGNEARSKWDVDMAELLERIKNRKKMGSGSSEAESSGYEGLPQLKTYPRAEETQSPGEAKSENKVAAPVAVAPKKEESKKSSGPSKDTVKNVAGVGTGIGVGILAAILGKRALKRAGGLVDDGLINAGKAASITDPGMALTKWKPPKGKASDNFQKINKTIYEENTGHIPKQIGTSDKSIVVSNARPDTIYSDKSAGGYKRLEEKNRPPRVTEAKITDVYAKAMDEKRKGILSPEEISAGESKEKNAKDALGKMADDTITARKGRLLIEDAKPEKPKAPPKSTKQGKKASSDKKEVPKEEPAKPARKKSALEMASSEVIYDKPVAEAVGMGPKRSEFLKPKGKLIDDTKPAPKATKPAAKEEPKKAVKPTEKPAVKPAAKPKRGKVVDDKPVKKAAPKPKKVVNEKDTITEEEFAQILQAVRNKGSVPTEAYNAAKFIFDQVTAQKHNFPHIDFEKLLKTVK